MIAVEHLSQLGKALKDLRWSARMTQAEICAQTRMNAPQLSRYENGREVPTLESLIKYLSAIGYDLCDLQRVLTGEVDLRPSKGEGPKILSPEIGAAETSPSSHEVRQMVSDLLRPNAEGLARLEQRVQSLEKHLKHSALSSAS